jgi:alpha-ribazole phosphatase/probable phosphoglycerate mutase
MKPLLMIRHLETDLKGTFCGHSDPSLNENGRTELPALLNKLSNFDISKIFISDLLRCRQTAEAIAKQFGAEIEVRPNLREIYFGKWEGLTWDRIQRDDPSGAERWMKAYPRSTAPDGELFSDFESRVLQEMEYLRQQSATSQITVVTHAGVMQVSLTRTLGFSPEQAWQMTRPYGAVCMGEFSEPMKHTAGADSHLHEGEKRVRIG